MKLGRERCLVPMPGAFLGNVSFPAKILTSIFIACFLTLAFTWASEPGTQTAQTGAGRPTLNAELSPDYPVGVGDVLTLWALGAEELSDKPFRVDNLGYIDAPIIGRVRVAGLTVNQIREDMQRRLQSDLRDPHVTVNITEVHSQPVTILGAVNHPGVYQLPGRKSLSEALSSAEGLRSDAGNVIYIKRRTENDWLSLPNATKDPSGQFVTTQISVGEVLKGSQGGVLLAPNDVITVPASPLVYVIGEVNRPGGFVIGSRDNISILQAIAMADGLGKFALDKNARILRMNGNETRTEIPVNIRNILAGKAPDFGLRPDDILVVPNNNVKRGWSRAVETATSAITGVAIYRVGLAGF